MFKVMDAITEIDRQNKLKAVAFSTLAPSSTVPTKGATTGALARKEAEQHAIRALAFLFPCVNKAERSEGG